MAKEIIASPGGMKKLQGDIGTLSEQIGNLVKTVNISISNISANAGKGGSADVPSVSGMSPVCAIPIGTNHSDTVITECRLTTSDTKVSISIYNLYSGGAQDAVGTVAIVYK